MQVVRFFFVVFHVLCPSTELYQAQLVGKIRTNTQSTKITICPYLASSTTAPFSASTNTAPFSALAAKTKHANVKKTERSFMASIVSESNFCFFLNNLVVFDFSETCVQVCGTWYLSLYWTIFLQVLVYWLCIIFSLLEIEKAWIPSSLGLFFEFYNAFRCDFYFYTTTDSTTRASHVLRRTCTYGVARRPL